MSQATPKTRYDNRTDQHVPVLEFPGGRHVDISPTSFDKERAQQIAQEAADLCNLEGSALVPPKTIKFCMWERGPEPFDPETCPAIHVGSEQADKYRAGNSVAYEPPDGGRVYPVITILPILTGKPWDDAALAMVSTQHPTAIRVIEHGQGTKLDAYYGRVTVKLGEDGLIDHLYMESSAWAPPGVEGAHHLELILAGRPQDFRPGGISIANPAGVCKVQFDISKC